MKVEQSVPKRRHIKFRRRGITQKKTCNSTLSVVKSIFSFYSLLLLCLGTAGSKPRRSALCRPADTISLLSCRLPRPLPSFPYATELFFLHVFRFGRHSVFGHRLFRLFSKFFFRLAVLQHVSASLAVRRGCCCCCPDFGVFWVFG